MPAKAIQGDLSNASHRKLYFGQSPIVLRHSKSKQFVFLLSAKNSSKKLKSKQILSKKFLLFVLVNFNNNSN